MRADEARQFIAAHHRAVLAARRADGQPQLSPVLCAVDEAGRVIGVVVSGSLDDGTAGLRAIKAQGGLAVVQDPDEAFARSMPDSARLHVDIDYIEPMAQLASRLGQLVADPVDAAPSGANPGLETETEIRRHPDETIPPDAPVMMRM